MLNVMSYCLPTPEVNNSLYRIKNTNTNLLLAFKLTDLGMISRTGHVQKPNLTLCSLARLP